MLEFVCIGGSAGAIEALGALLPALPKQLCTAVVVHLPPKEASLLVEIFAPKCQQAVREVEDKDECAPGTVFFAPPDYHLLVEPGGSFALSVDDPVNFSRPAIDPLFESAADAYGARMACVVLTGASNDGAAGAKRVKAAGGRVLVQTPDSAEVSVMPRAALNAVDADFVGTPAQLAAHLTTLAREGT